ncbi:MAG: hypothetical protein AAF483_31155 [Planctomycetota bacterium]
MTNKSKSFSRNQIALLSLGLLLVSSGLGCINFVANMIHAVHGDMIPAEFDKLGGKKVAVVCRTDEGFQANATNSILHNNLQMALATNIEDVKLVRRSEIQNWLNSNGWEESDYFTIGKGVEADLVVAVEVANLKLRNGPTLYRGQADVSVKVYDIEHEGVPIYHKQMNEIAFPQNSGKPITDTSESKFRQFYLAYLTRKIGALFYPVDATADYALDATMSSF